MFALSGTYVLSGSCAAGVYVAERLFLNRPQLITERRADFLESRLSEFEAFARAAIRELSGRNDTSANKLLGRIGEAIIELNQQFRESNKKRPYELTEIRRRK